MINTAFIKLNLITVDFSRNSINRSNIFYVNMSQ